MGNNHRPIAKSRVGRAVALFSAWTVKPLRVRAVRVARCYSKRRPTARIQDIPCESHGINTANAPSAVRRKSDCEPESAILFQPRFACASSRWPKPLREIGNISTQPSGGALWVTWSQVSSAFGRRSADVRGDANICYGSRRLIARDFKAWCEVWSKTTRACVIFIRSAELRADREWRNRFGAIHESASIL